MVDVNLGGTSQLRLDILRKQFVSAIRAGQEHSVIPVGVESGKVGKWYEETGHSISTEF